MKTALFLLALCLSQVFSQGRPHLINERLQYSDCSGSIDLYTTRLLDVCYQKSNSTIFTSSSYSEFTKQLTIRECTGGDCVNLCQVNTQSLPSDLDVCDSGVRWRIANLDPKGTPEYSADGQYVVRAQDSCLGTVEYESIGLMNKKCLELSSKFYIVGLLNTTHSFMYDYETNKNCSGTPIRYIFQNTTVCTGKYEFYPKKVYKSCFGLIQDVDNNICSGNGQCNSTDSCVCKAGWSGTQCETIGCGGCSGNGRCLQPNVCTCNSGWGGANCSIPDCGGCSGNGRCLQPNVCSCNSGWGGINCSVPDCGGCSGNGRCLQPNNCTCNSGWTGTTCNQAVNNNNQTTISCFGIPSNSSTVCSGNGRCTSPNNCVCNTGFTAPLCTKTNSAGALTLSFSLIIIGFGFLF